jgi:hypothetical protein
VSPSWIHNNDVSVHGYAEDVEEIKRVEEDVKGQVHLAKHIGLLGQPLDTLLSADD